MYLTLETAIEQCNKTSPFFSKWSSYSLLDFRDALISELLDKKIKKHGKKKR